MKSPKMYERVLIASGVLSWHKRERVSNRYGGFFLDEVPYNGQTPVCKPAFNKEAIRPFQGKHVKLTAKVIDARKSGHVGDFALGIFPSQPEIGEEIELGIGPLNVYEEGDFNCFSLLPSFDNRQELWLDPRKLYRLHDQTIELYAEFSHAPCHMAPDLKEAESGTVSTGPEEGGGFGIQVKKAPIPRQVNPKITRLGDGMFMLRSPAAEAGTPVPTSGSIPQPLPPSERSIFDDVDE